ncbi:MAG: hypothetical protein ACRCX2_31460 [Paraclostridium sp.]
MKRVEHKTNIYLFDILGERTSDYLTLVIERVEFVDFKIKKQLRPVRFEIKDGKCKIDDFDIKKLMIAINSKVNESAKDLSISESEMFDPEFTKMLHIPFINRHATKVNNLIPEVAMDRNNDPEDAVDCIIIPDENINTNFKKIIRRVSEAVIFYRQQSVPMVMRTKEYEKLVYEMFLLKSYSKPGAYSDAVFKFFKELFVLSLNGTFVTNAKKDLVYLFSISDLKHGEFYRIT